MSAQSSGISIVIPSYSRGQVLLDTIRHLLELSARPDEILIVDQTEEHPPEILKFFQALEQKLPINVTGFHGATEAVEGAVWRVERDKPTGKNGNRRIVSFLCKYVRPDKVDGNYLPSQSGQDSVWNWEPDTGDGSCG